MDWLEFHYNRNGGFRCQGFWATPYQATHSKIQWLVAAGWYEEEENYWCDEEYYHIVAHTKETAAKKAMKKFRKEVWMQRKKTYANTLR